MINCIYSNEKEQCLHKHGGIKRLFTGQCGMSWTRPCPDQEQRVDIEPPIIVSSSPFVSPEDIKVDEISTFEKAEIESSLNTGSPNFFEGGLSGGGGAERSWNNDPPNSDPTDGGSWDSSSSDNASNDDNSND